MNDPNNWLVIDNRIILFIDIMGFKNLVNSVHPQQLYDHLKSTMELTVEMKHMGYADLDRAGRTHFPEVKSQIFSDSIVFVTKGITPSDIYVITKGAKWVSTILFQHHITFKGAIASGVMTYDETNSIIFGQPLINAFLLQEELDLFGITVHHSFEHLLKTTFKTTKCMDSLQDYVPYPIRTNKGKAKHLILDWIKYAQEIHGNTFNEEMYSYLSCEMSGGPKFYLDNTYEFNKVCIERPFIDRDYTKK